MEWNNEKTTSFIEDYYNSPELWNNKISEYKDFRIKSKKLQQLAIKYGCTVTEVKKKIKNLRSAFHRERKKLHTKKGGSSPIKKTKWFAYELLSFLVDVEIPTLSAAGSEEEDFEEEEQEVIRETRCTQVKVNESRKLHEASNKRDRKSCEEEREKYSEDVLKRHPKKTRKDLSTWNHEEKAHGMLKNVCQRDDCSTYGEHVANELRNLSSRARIMVKHIINNTLFEAAIGKYDVEITPSHASTPLHNDESNSCVTVLSSGTEFTPRYTSSH